MFVCQKKDGATLRYVSSQHRRLGGVYAGLLDILLSALQWTAGTVSDTHSPASYVPVCACVCLHVCIDLQFVI